VLLILPPSVSVVEKKVTCPITVLRRSISKPPRSRTVTRSYHTTEKVTHVSKETAMAEPEVMLGTFDVHSIPATVLFDCGASHSFISQLFVKTHSIPLCAMKNPILVNSPGGKYASFLPMPPY
jgi:hypothetical protein